MSYLKHPAPGLRMGREAERVMNQWRVPGSRRNRKQTVLAKEHDNSRSANIRAKVRRQELRANAVDEVRAALGSLATSFEGAAKAFGPLADLASRLKEDRP